MLSEHLEQEGLELLFEGGGELRGEDVLIKHRSTADILLHQVVQGLYQHQGLVIGHLEGGRKCAQHSGQVVTLETRELRV